MLAPTIPEMNQETGTEPIIVLQINFGAGSNWYSTRSVQLEDGPWCDAKIVSVGELIHTKREDNFANTGSMTIRLDDSDGRVKSIFDITSIEKSPAAVYLMYRDVVNGNSIGDLLLLIKGEIAGPIKWEEGQRLLDFTIEIPQDHNEFGFAPTKDDFPDLSDDAVAIPWPVAFGKVAHVPAVHVRKRITGTLMTDIRLESNIYNFVRDSGGKTVDIKIDDKPNVRAYLPEQDGEPSTTEETNKIFIWNGESFPQQQDIKIIIDNVIFEGTFDINNEGKSTTFTIKTETGGKVIGVNIPRFKDVQLGTRHDPNLLDDKGHNITDKDGSVIKVKQYNKCWLDKDQPIINYWCYVKVPGGAHEWPNLCVMQNKTECTFKYPFVNPNNKNNLREPTLLTRTNSFESVLGVQKHGYDKDITEKVTRLREALQGRNGLGLVTQTLATLRNDKAGFWQRPADTEVRLFSEDGEDPDIYICNLAPVDTVLAVYGRREIYGKKVFTQIPESYYTVSSSNYKIKNSFVTALLFNTPLLDYKDQKWDDQVYVSMKCALDRTDTYNNTAMQLKWIIKHFTKLKVDNSSFDKVKDELANYPTNFAVFERRDAIKVAQDIAWQARCALTLHDDIVSIKFLAKQPTPVFAFEVNNIEYKSQVLAFSETREITTKLVGTWSSTYKDLPPPTKHNERITTEIKEVIRAMLKQGAREKGTDQYTIYTENIDKFGNKPREERIFIYDNETSVKKTLTFWGHRFANSWRLTEFKGFYSSILLQPFDCIQIITPKLSVGIAIVEEVRFNYNDHSVTIRAWIPVKVGQSIIDTDYFNN